MKDVMNELAEALLAQLTAVEEALTATLETGMIEPDLVTRITSRTSAFRFANDDAFAISDPKHPDYHSVHADLWDMREKG